MNTEETLNTALEEYEHLAKQLMQAEGLPYAAALAGVFQVVRDDAEYFERKAERYAANEEWAGMDACRAHAFGLRRWMERKHTETQ